MESSWTWSEAHKDWYQFVWRSDLEPDGDLIWGRSEFEAREPPPQLVALQPLPYSQPIAYPYPPLDIRPIPIVPPASGPPVNNPSPHPPTTTPILSSVTFKDPSPPLDPVNTRSRKRGRSQEKGDFNIPFYNPAPDPRFQLIGNARGWYKKGRIFIVVWPEPQGESMPATTTNATSSTQPTPAVEPLTSTTPDLKDSTHAHHVNDSHADTEHTLSQIHIKERRFVVYRWKGKHCICFPIYTYSRQGTSKTSVNPEDHAPLVKQGTEVVYHPQENPSKLKKPLTFVVEDHDVQWNPLSRINVGKPMSVECNLKVRKVGRLDSANMLILDTYVRESILRSEE